MNQNKNEIMIYLKLKALDCLSFQTIRIFVCAESTLTQYIFDNCLFLTFAAGNIVPAL